MAQSCISRKIMFTQENRVFCTQSRTDNNLLALIQFITPDWKLIIKIGQKLTNCKVEVLKTS